MMIVPFAIAFTGTVSLALIVTGFYAPRTGRIGRWAVHLGVVLANGCIWTLALLGGVALPASLGGAVLSNVVFQGLVNYDYRKTFIDPGEARSYSLLGLEVPKILTLSLPGRLRYVQLIIGAGLVLAGVLS